MKRIILNLTTLLLIVGFVGCSEDKTPRVSTSPENANDVTQTETDHPVTTQSDENNADSRPAGERMTLEIKGVEYAFHWIPAGTFMMGSSKEEQEEALANDKKYRDRFNGDYSNEVQHKVNISRGFWMLESPITQGMWESVMGYNPSRFKGSDRLPAEWISWGDCQEYIEKLNGLGVCPDGYKFSLPTEAEWEYACRAGTTTPFWFGDSLNGDNANCDGNYPYGTDEKGPCLEGTSEVGKYPANPWGLYDMHGNVLEWCADRFSDYPTDEVTDPTGDENGMGYVVRGGNWESYAVFCRAAYRFGRSPFDRGFHPGARLALRPQ